jgi:hypothetical protein
MRARMGARARARAFCRRAKSADGQKEKRRINRAISEISLSVG